VGLTKQKRQLQSLPFPDLLFVRAAEGWLELGNPHEATQELVQIRPRFRAHPDVLLVRWHIFACTSQWDKCLVLARALAEGAPHDARSWIALAETFFKRGDITRAYATAVANTVDFPESCHLLYDTARYACQLGKRDEAEQYLRLAMAVGNAREIKHQAMRDPHLAGLWRPA
jgi:hypothetical protein